MVDGTVYFRIFSNSSPYWQTPIGPLNHCEDQKCPQYTKGALVKRSIFVKCDPDLPLMLGKLLPCENLQLGLSLRFGSVMFWLCLPLWGTLEKLGREFQKELEENQKRWGLVTSGACLGSGPSGSKLPGESACNAGDLGSTTGSGRSLREGNGNQLQYPCPGNPMDRGAWRATVHGVTTDGHDLVTKSAPYHHQTQISLLPQKPMRWNVRFWNLVLYLPAPTSSALPQRGTAGLTCLGILEFFLVGPSEHTYLILNSEHSVSDKTKDKLNRDDLLLIISTIVQEEICLPVCFILMAHFKPEFHKV